MGKDAAIKKIIQILILIILILGTFVFVWEANAAVRKEFNYQGKLTDSSGTIVSDGAYDIVFKIYTQAGGGSVAWMESWTGASLFTETATTMTNDGCAAGIDRVAYTTNTNEGSLKAGQALWNITTKQSAVIESVDTASNFICIYDPAAAWTTGDDVTNRIYVKNGLFSAMVGSVTDLTVDFTGNTYYLGVTVGTDNEMIPRKKIGSVPQAWNANSLVGNGYIDIDNTSTSQDAANINYNPASGNYNALSIVYGSAGGTGTGLSITQNGTGDIVDFRDGTVSVFKIADGGNVTMNALSFTQNAVNPVHKGAIFDSQDSAVYGLGGAWSVYVQGKYAYVASYQDYALEIIDISNPASPTHIGVIKDSDNAAVYGLGGARSVYVQGKYAYVASNIDNALEIIDISNPASPTHIGVIKDADNAAVYGLNSASSVYVSGKYAYVASSTDSALEIIDISNPASPTHIGVIKDADNAAVYGLAGANSVYVSGKYAYVASYNDDALEIIDISNPASPTHIGVIKDSDNAAVYGLDAPWSVYVSGKYAYVASLTDNALEIIDVSNPAFPTHVGVIKDADNAAVYGLAGANSVYVSGKYAYVASLTDNALEIIDVSNPASPTHIGVIKDSDNAAVYGLDNARSVYVSGKYAYVGSLTDSALEILELSGFDLPSANIGDLNVSTIDVTDNASIANNLYIGNGLNVGSGGIYSSGGIYTLGEISGYANSTRTALTITQNSTGNIVDFKDGATTVFKIADGGDATFTGNVAPGTNASYNLGSQTTDTTIDLTMTGEATNNYFGQSVAPAGDVNGDGYKDFVIGASGYSSSSGRAYVYYGGSTLNNVADVTMTGNASSSSFGSSVSSAGDVNGDGYDDIIIGAHYDDTNGNDSGQAYIFYGGSSMDNVADVTFSNSIAGNNLGKSVSSAGDINGDGYGDVIVGAQGVNSYTGAAYIYFGGPTMDTVADITLSGAAASSSFGSSVSSAGDINGDGYGDVIVGADSVDSSTGAAYIYFGGPTMDTVADITLSGAATSNNFGSKVASAGDVNGDGFNDVMVGAYGYSTQTGRAYVYYGGAAMDNTADVTMTGGGTGYYFGLSLGAAGDLNGDGYNDVIVSALGYSTSTGRAYVYYGGAAMNATADITFTGAGTNYRFGQSVAGAGDLNGDGYPDILVGASDYSTSTGRAYVYTGSGYRWKGIAGQNLNLSRTLEIGDLTMDRWGINAGNAFGIYAPNWSVSRQGTGSFQDLLVGGNVGIGGISPTSKLDVSQNSTQSALTVSQNGTGDIVDFKDGTTSVFRIGKATIEATRPLDLQVEGDVGIEYNLQFMSNATSYVTSSGPLVIAAGDSNSYEHLTLTTNGTGDVIVDIASSALGFRVIGSSGKVFSVDPSGNVAIGGVNSSDSDLTVKRNISTQGGNLILDNLDTPADVAVAVVGTAGGTTYGYRVSAINGNGETLASATVTTSTGNATLSSSNYNRITWSPVTGATGYKIYGRTASSELYMATVSSPSLYYNDTGTATPSGALPTVNNTGGTIIYPSTGGPKRSIILTAAGAVTPDANGASQTKITGTNNAYYVLDYDAAADESAYWHWTMPDSYDGGTIDITYYWQAASTSGEVGWCFQAVGIAANNAESIDSSFSSAICEVSTAAASANSLVSVTESKAASNFAPGEYVAFKVFRDADGSIVGGGNDDMAGDARLVKVKIEYSINAESD